MAPTAKHRPVRAILDESVKDSKLKDIDVSQEDHQRAVVDGSVQTLLCLATHAWDASLSAHIAIIKVRDADLLRPWAGTMDLWSFVLWHSPDVGRPQHMCHSEPLGAATSLSLLIRQLYSPACLWTEFWSEVGNLHSKNRLVRLQPTGTEEGREGTSFVSYIFLYHLVEWNVLMFIIFRYVWILKSSQRKSA